MKSAEEITGLCEIVSGYLPQQAVVIFIEITAIERLRCDCIANQYDYDE